MKRVPAMAYEHMALEPGTALIAPDSAWGAIVNALRDAADNYEQAARECPYAELVEPMTQQAKEARALSDVICREVGI